MAPPINEGGHHFPEAAKDGRCLHTEANRRFAAKVDSGSTLHMLSSTGRSELLCSGQTAMPVTNGQRRAQPPSINRLTSSIHTVAMRSGKCSASMWKAARSPAASKFFSCRPAAEYVSR